MRQFSASNRISGKLSKTETRRIVDKKSELKVAVRLLKMGQMLDSPKRFKYSTMDCFKIYDAEKFTLIDDLLAIPDHQIQKTIFSNFKISKLMAAFVLDQLNTIILKGREDRAIEFLCLMDKEGVLDKKNTQKVEVLKNGTLDSQQVGSHLASILVMENLRTGEPLMATLCALKFLEHNAVIDLATLVAVLRSLSINTPNRKTYHAYAIRKLLEKFKNHEVDVEVKIGAIQSMLGGPVVPYFANITYDEFIAQNEEIPQLPFTVLTAQLIEANLDNGNILRCVQLWKDAYARNRDFAKKHIILFSKVIDKLAAYDQEKALELANQHFPEDLHKKSEVVDSLLALYGQNAKLVAKFEKLTHELKSPLLRTTLSLLFAAFLFQRNEVAAERILQAIFRTKNGLTSNDFKTIVKRLLRQQKIQQSATMCQNTDINVAKEGYVKTIEFLLTHPKQSLSASSDVEPEQLEKLKQGFFTLAVRKFQILQRTDPALTDLTVTIFKYLSGYVSNKASRKLYIVFLSAYVSLKPYFAFQSFQMPKEFNDLVYIDKNNRLTCLTVILNQAIIEKDGTTIKWALKELMAAGILDGEIRTNYMTPHVQSIFND